MSKAFAKSRNTQLEIHIQEKGLRSTDQLSHSRRFIFADDIYHAINFVSWNGAVAQFRTRFAQTLKLTKICPSQCEKMTANLSN